MHVVRGGHVHRINVVRLFFQELAPILVDFDIRISLFEFDGAVEVHFRDRHQLQFAELGQLMDVGPGLASSSKTGVTQNAVWRLGHQPARDERRGNRGRSETLEERTAGEKGRHLDFVLSGHNLRKP